MVATIASWLENGDLMKSRFGDRWPDFSEICYSTFAGHVTIAGVDLICVQPWMSVLHTSAWFPHRWTSTLSCKSATLGWTSTVEGKSGCHIIKSCLQCLCLQISQCKKPVTLKGSCPGLQAASSVRENKISVSDIDPDP